MKLWIVAAWLALLLTGILGTICAALLTMPEVKLHPAVLATRTLN